MTPIKAKRTRTNEALTPEIMLVLATYREFLAQRDRAMQSLLGRRIAPTRLRDEIIRVTLIEFGNGRQRRLSFYQRELAGFASRSAIRDEIHALARMGVLILEPDPTDRRAICIIPTQRLIEWSVQQVPLLEIEMRKLWRDTAPQPRNGRN